MELSQKERLTEKQIAILQTELMKSQRQVGFAYVLTLIGGFFGLHKLYLERTGHIMCKTSISKKWNFSKWKC